MGKIWRYIRLNIPTFGSSIVIALLVGVYSIISFFNIVFLPERYDILMIPALSFLLLVLMFIVIDTYENLKKAQHITYYRNKDASLKVVNDIVKEALLKSKSEQTGVDILVANLEYSNPGNGKIQDYEKDIMKAINDPNGKYTIFYKYLIAKCPQKKEWCSMVEEEIANNLPSGKFELRYTKKDLSFPMFNMLIVPQLKKTYLGLGNDPTFYQGGILITGSEMENFASQFESYFQILFTEKYSDSYNQSESEKGGSHV